MPIYAIFNFNLLPDLDSNSKRKYLCINETSINGFKNDFDLKFSALENLNVYSAKDSFHQFTEIFKELYEKWFVHENSTRCKNVHVKSEWITPAIAKSSTKKNSLYQQWRKHRTSKNWNLYITYKRKLETLKNKVK